MKKTQQDGTKQAQGAAVPDRDAIVKWIADDLKAFVALCNMLRNDPEMLIALADKIHGRIEAKKEADPAQLTIEDQVNQVKNG